MTLITEDVEVGRNLLGNKMIWVGEKITVAGLLDKYSYLKEEFGLNALRLAYSVGLSEMVSQLIFLAIIIEGYRPAKSKAATFKCSPFVPSLNGS